MSSGGQLEEELPIDLGRAKTIVKMNPPLPMTSVGKGDHQTRFETAFGTMISPSTAIAKNEERTKPKPTHSRKPTWPEETAFS